MISELLLIKACIVSRQPGIQMQEEAEKISKKALSVARQQGSLSSQLKVAIGLVRLRHTTGPAEDARAVLREIFGQFREGFETTDLQRSQDSARGGLSGGRQPAHVRTRTGAMWPAVSRPP